MCTETGYTLFHQRRKSQTNLMPFLGIDNPLYHHPSPFPSSKPQLYPLMVALAAPAVVTAPALVVASAVTSAVAVTPTVTVTVVTSVVAAPQQVLELLELELGSPSPPPSPASGPGAL